MLVAAGRSTRMSASGERKPLLSLRGRTVLEHAAAPFAAIDAVAQIVLVVHADDVRRVAVLCQSSPTLAKVVAVAPGGAERADSVRIGVLAVASDVEVICIHDAARPLVRRELVERAIAVAAERDVALVATPVRDTIKVSSTGTHAESTLDRSVLWSAQTPQVFRASVLRDLVRRAQQDSFAPTDDVALYEQYVGPVPMVEGDPTNLKITTPDDLMLAEAILEAREAGTR